MHFVLLTAKFSEIIPVVKPWLDVNRRLIAGFHCNISIFSHNVIDHMRQIIISFSEMQMLVLNFVGHTVAKMVHIGLQRRKIFQNLPDPPAVIIGGTGCMRKSRQNLHPVSLIIRSICSGKRREALYR